jgi:hypothetical protein
MKTPTAIISDAEIERVHGNANFGSLSKRGVINEGVLKAAFGYSAGHTMQCILEEHGLIRKTRPKTYAMTLTKKGGEYLRSVYGQHFNAIFELAPLT